MDYLVLEGRTWKHVTDKYPIPLCELRKLLDLSGGKGLNTDKVIEIKYLLDNNENLQKIANKYNVHIETIRNIKNKKSWAHIII